MRPDAPVGEARNRTHQCRPFFLQPPANQNVSVAYIRHQTESNHAT
jgi:hypothetical protein